jgi:hypothetical protein
MNTDFTIVSGETVLSDYSWDKGIPFTSGIQSTTIIPTVQYIFGYAPGLKVRFANVSNFNNNFKNLTYTWNFGDYYHDTTNIISLTSLDSVDHIFVMPGKYTIQLQVEETLLDPNSSLTPEDFKCLGKFNVRWFWNDLTSDKQNNITWNQTRCLLQDNTVIDEDRRPKWWFAESQCIEKYCKDWSWYSLSNESDIQPIKWRETKTDAEFEKKWQLEENNIECASILAVAPFKETVRKSLIVEVKEIPPTAGITCLTRPLTGKSPFTVELSPKGCKSGSFPIDRIDWNFGDGSPIVTITRYSQNNFENVIKKIPLALSADPDDVRNYNVTHTYVTDRNTYPIFYPSLTCYSANTNTFDSCCTIIGPILADYQPSNAQILKTRNTDKGNIYVLSLNENVGFFTTSTKLTSSSLQQDKITTPSAPVRDTFFAPNYDFFGNPGNDYLNAPEISIT